MMTLPCSSSCIDAASGSPSANRAIIVSRTIFCAEYSKELAVLDNNEGSS
uniref:Uncharacterized protein n=1 Tax=Anguilla anguilla TaxID=7936 RepID=A0A0E9W3W2_ANGAN